MFMTVFTLFLHAAEYFGGQSLPIYIKTRNKINSSYQTTKQITQGTATVLQI
jgi:hypothetical protein